MCLFGTKFGSVGNREPVPLGSRKPVSVGSRGRVPVGSIRAVPVGTKSLCLVGAVSLPVSVRSRAPASAGSREPVTVGGCINVATQSHMTQPADRVASTVHLPSRARHKLCMGLWCQSLDTTTS